MFSLIYVLIKSNQIPYAKFGLVKLILLPQQLKKIIFKNYCLIPHSRVILIEIKCPYPWNINCNRCFTIHMYIAASSTGSLWRSRGERTHGKIGNKHKTKRGHLGTSAKCERGYPALPIFPGAPACFNYFFYFPLL